MGCLADQATRVFLATDAASEGINLQRTAHHLVHIDVPWNPNRYIQRNGRIDRYGQDRRPQIWVLVAADRSARQGRSEARALELLAEKLRQIESELGSVGDVLPRVASSSVRDLLADATRNTEVELDEVLATRSGIEADWTRLTAHNRTELAAAERYVSQLGVHDDFEGQLGDLLRRAFRGWDDGGALVPAGPGLYRVSVPDRLQAEVGTDHFDQATFRRELAVADLASEADAAAEFLSPAHPLAAATLRELRDEATRSGFAHRFDVMTADEEGLVLSFLARFLNGDGRTGDERLEAVEVSLDGVAGTDPVEALHRLGVDARSDPRPVDPSALPRWQQAFPNSCRRL